MGKQTLFAQFIVNLCAVCKGVSLQEHSNSLEKRQQSDEKYHTLYVCVGLKQQRAKVAVPPVTFVIHYFQQKLNIVMDEWGEQLLGLKLF